jgi:fatty-acyl-CoA synthase
MAAIAGGAHIVCLAKFDGEAAVRLIRQHQVTHVIGGDDMFGRIAAASGGRRFDSVRFSGFAAFHSSAAASIAAAEVAGMQPHGLYGSSEVQALFSVSEGKNHLLPGGVPVSIQARLAVRDPKTGSTLPSGASGELWIDAPSRFIEYLEDPAATERAIDADGMFRTGDLARLADTGFVYESRAVTDIATPVTLPVGRLKLLITPVFNTTSLPKNTIGTVVVAAAAASTTSGPPVEAITATRRLTRSAASAGNRS